MKTAKGKHLAIKWAIKWAILSTLIFWTARPVEAAQKQIRFIAETHLDGLGIKLNLMPHSVSRPLSSPNSYHYTFTRGDQTRKEELFDPTEIWFQSQHAGRWSDRDGNTLSLATISSFPPQGFARKHASQDEYTRVMGLPENAPPTVWNMATLSKWVCQFVRTAKAEGVSVRNPPLNIQNAVRFKLAGQPPTRIAYAIRVRPTRATAQPHDNPWILVLLDLTPGFNATRAPSTIENTLFRSIRRIGITTAAKIKTRSNSMQNSGHTGGESDTFKRSRKTAIRSIVNMKSWWYAETENYIVLSDLSGRHRPMVKALQKNIEALRNVYQKLIPPLAPISAVSVIRIPSDTGVYIDYVGIGNEWTGGMWKPAIRELIIRPIDHGSTRDQRQRLLRVAYHEAFHQYLFYALANRTSPPWFNEGHAELFESSTISSQGVTIEENDQNVSRLLNMIKRGRVPIRELIALDYPQFYDRDPEKRADNYALAWGLIYYLRKGSAQEHPARHAQLCSTLLKALSENHASATPTQRTFNTVNMQALEKQFITFWTSRQRRSQAKRSNLR